MYLDSIKAIIWPTVPMTPNTDPNKALNSPNSDWLLILFVYKPFELRIRLILTDKPEEIDKLLSNYSSILNELPGFVIPNEEMWYPVCFLVGVVNSEEKRSKLNTVGTLPLKILSLSELIAS